MSSDWSSDWSSDNCWNWDGWNTTIGTEELKSVADDNMIIASDNDDNDDNTDSESEDLMNVAASVNPGEDNDVIKSSVKWNFVPFYDNISDTKKRTTDTKEAVQKFRNNNNSEISEPWNVAPFTPDGTYAKYTPPDKDNDKTSSGSKYVDIRQVMHDFHKKETKEETKEETKKEPLEIWNDGIANIFNTICADTKPDAVRKMVCDMLVAKVNDIVLSHESFKWLSETNDDDDGPNVNRKPLEINELDNFFTDPLGLAEMKRQWENNRWNDKR